MKHINQTQVQAIVGVMKPYHHHRSWKAISSSMSQLLSDTGHALMLLIYLASGSISLIFVASLVWPPASKAIDFVISNFTGWWPTGL